MNKNCYTYLLILPEVSNKDLENKGEFNPKVTLLNFLDYVLIYDDKFAKDCKTTTLHVVVVHYKGALSTLEHELIPPSNCVDIKAVNYKFQNILMIFVMMVMMI